jgi:hypothetical protein
MDKKQFIQSCACSTNGGIPSTRDAVFLIEVKEQISSTSEARYI